MLVYVDRTEGVPFIRSEDDSRKFWMGEFRGVGSICYIYWTHRGFTGDDDDYEVVAAFTHRGIADPVYELIAKQLGARKADHRSVISAFRQIGRKLCHLDNLAT